jgi:hypothetical protein
MLVFRSVQNLLPVPVRGVSRAIEPIGKMARVNAGAASSRQSRVLNGPAAGLSAFVAVAGGSS